ncbi:MAG: hypothetical protein WC477_06855 [Patescibacteria group bacterium]
MANHGYVISESFISNEAFECAVREINSRRFGGLLNVSPLEGSDAGWFLSLGEPAPFHVGRCLWLNPVNEVEIRHGGDDFEWWLDTVFMDELGLAFQGVLRDDGCDFSWSPKSDLYVTFADFLLRNIIPVSGVARSEEALRYLGDEYRQRIGMLKLMLPGWSKFIGSVPSHSALVKMLADNYAKVKKNDS